MSSGTNRLILSQNTMKKGGQTALASALRNANEVAAKSLIKSKPKKGKK